MKINNQKVKSLALLSLIGSTSAKKGNQSEINLNSLSQIGTNLAKRGDDSSQTLIYAGMSMFLRGNSADNLNIDQKRCVSSFALVIPEEGDCQWQGFPNSGFITSARCCQSGHCGANNVFLNNPPQDVGSVADSTFFFPEPIEPMADRTFLSVYDKGLILTPHVRGKKGFFPIIGLGSATLGSDVCAYGAVSGYLCGKVVEMDTTLKLPNPMYGGYATIINLNKVDLGENGFEYEEDLGSPVYTVSNIGDRTVAQALGHISNIDYSNSQHKFFYYTPLDTALEALAKYQGCNYALLTYNETNAQQYDQLIAQMEIPAKK